MACIVPYCVISFPVPCYVQSCAENHVAVVANIYWSVNSMQTNIAI